ncbi:MAG: hypothetical protein PHE52_00080 [Candidatus Pacebacteria bacterium]|nr:hypothetical protein [Candidatus Paceibacterota bacterium]
MDTYSECPGLTGTKRKIVSISLIVFLAGTVFLWLPLPKIEADLVLDDSAMEEKLAILEEDTLIAVSNPTDPDPKIVQTLPVIVTAYSSTVWETDDSPFITAAGTEVRDGIIANNILPFGTRVRIPELYGDRIFVVEDRMSWKKSNYHIDIWLPSYSEAKDFGAKRTYIEVLES